MSVSPASDARRLRAAMPALQRLAREFLLAALAFGLALLALVLATRRPLAYATVAGAAAYAGLFAGTVYGYTRLPLRAGGLLALGLLILLNTATVNPLMFLADYGPEAYWFFRIVGLAIGLPLATFSALAWWRTRGEASTRTPLDAPYWALGVGIAALGVGVGVVRGNDPIYIVGDAYKWFVPLGGYLIVARSLSAADTRFLVAALAWSSALQGVAGLLLHLYQLAAGLTYVRFGGHGLLGLIYFAYQALHDPRPRRRFLWMLAYGVLLTEMFVSLSRSTWIQVALVHAAMLALEPKGPVLRFAARWAALAALGAAVLAAGINAAPILDRAASRLEEFYGGDAEFGSISGHRKFVEVESVVSNLRDGPAEQWVVGAGLGSEYYVLEPSKQISTIYAFRDERVHNIHNTLAAVFFRTGVVGTAVFLWLIGATLRAALWWMRRAPAGGPGRIEPVVVAMFLALTFLKCLSVSEVVGELPWGILAGCAALHLQALRSGRPPHAEEPGA